MPTFGKRAKSLKDQQQDQQEPVKQLASRASSVTSISSSQFASAAGSVSGINDHRGLNRATSYSTHASVDDDDFESTGDFAEATFDEMFPALNAEHEKEHQNQMRDEHQHSMQLGVIAEKGIDEVPETVLEEFSTAVDVTDVITTDLTTHSEPEESIGQELVNAEQLGGEQKHSLGEQSAQVSPNDTEQAGELDLNSTGGGKEEETEEEAESESKRVELGPKDFDLLCMIGKGAYGRVLQVKERTTGKIYAMKVLKKAQVLRKRNTRYVRDERNILTKLDNPFIVQLKYAFQTENKLFLVLEYLNGGELFHHIRAEGLFLEDSARFYLAEIILGLDYLHSENIVHRDLKPENVLLDHNGHVRLTDFGLAKVVDHADDSKFDTICGTDLYMAPEMLAGTGYGKSVDWWSLGTLMFEMLTGDPPFYARDSRALYKKIMSSKPKYPSWLTSPCHSLLKGLLNRNVEVRLGVAKSTMFKVRGVQEVKNHPFFKKINWHKLMRKEIEPPIIPKVTCAADTSNFDEKFTKERPEEADDDTMSTFSRSTAGAPYGNANESEADGKGRPTPISLSKHGNEDTFAGFSFTHPSCFSPLARAVEEARTPEFAAVLVDGLQQDDAATLVCDGRGLPIRQAGDPSLASSLASSHSAGGVSSVGHMLQGASIRSMGDLIDAVNDTVIPPPSNIHVSNGSVGDNSGPHANDVSEDGPVLFTSVIPSSTPASPTHSTSPVAVGNSKSTPLDIPGSTDTTRQQSVTREKGPNNHRGRRGSNNGSKGNQVWDGGRGIAVAIGSHGGNSSRRSSGNRSNRGKGCNGNIDQTNDNGYNGRGHSGSKRGGGSDISQFGRNNNSGKSVGISGGNGSTRGGGNSRGVGNGSKRAGRNGSVDQSSGNGNIGHTSSNSNTGSSRGDGIGRGGGGGIGIGRGGGGGIGIGRGGGGTGRGGGGTGRGGWRGASTSGGESGRENKRTSGGSRNNTNQNAHAAGSANHRQDVGRSWSGSAAAASALGAVNRLNDPSSSSPGGAGRGGVGYTHVADGGGGINSNGGSGRSVVWNDIHSSGRASRGRTECCAAAKTGIGSIINPHSGGGRGGDGRSAWGGTHREDEINNHGVQQKQRGGRGVGRALVSAGSQIKSNGEAVTSYGTQPTSANASSNNSNSKMNVGARVWRPKAP